jgi:hypothetical protein
MGDDAILAAARAEKARLLTERERVIKRLEVIEQVIRAYAPEIQHSREIKMASGTNGHDADGYTISSEWEGWSEKAAILSAAEAYLRSKGADARAKTTELYEAVIRAGVRINAPDPRRAKDRVSGHLSGAKNRFNNEPGRGYGLNRQMDSDGNDQTGI